MEPLLRDIARHELPFVALLDYLHTSVPLARRDRALLQTIRSMLPTLSESDLMWLEYSWFPPESRRPMRPFDMELADFDRGGRCNNWGAVVSDNYKITRVLTSYYHDAARPVPSLPDGEESEEKASYEAALSSTLNLAAQIPFAIRVHRLWRLRDGDGLARLLSELEGSDADPMLHNERSRLAKLVLKCVEAEHDPSAPLFERLVLRSDMRALHEAVGTEIGGGVSGFEWLLDAWIERAAASLFLPNWESYTIPAPMLSSAALPHAPAMSAAAQSESLRHHLQSALRLTALDIQDTLPLTLTELKRRAVSTGVVTESEWREWREYDRDVLCELMDAVMSAITNERNLQPSTSARSPLSSPGVFAHTPSLLLRTYYATSAIGPAMSLLVQCWIDLAVPLRLQAMATAQSVAWPARCPAGADEAAGIALSMLSRRSGSLKLSFLETLLRVGRRNRISVHFVLMVVRDVARLGHPIAPLECDDRLASAYVSLMDGDYRTDAVQRAVHSVLCVDELHVTSEGAISFGDHASRDRLHRLSVVLPPIERRAWRAALQAWSGVDYGEDGSDEAEDSWFSHIMRPALDAWRRSSDESKADASEAAAAACVSELLDGPTRVAYDDLATRIDDVRRALTQTVTRQEVSHAIRTNELREVSDADMNAIRAEPLLFKYFESFCYRMNETYAGCMGKLSGQVKSNAGGHKVNFGALFNILPDVFGVKAGVALILAPAVIAMRVRSAGQACDFVRLASDPEEFAVVARAVAVRLLSDDRKRRQLRHALAREESQSICMRNIRASMRRLQRSRYDSTISRFAVHDAQVLVDAVMDGDLAYDTVERLRRTGDMSLLASALTGIVIQRTVTNTEENDGNYDGGKFGVVLQSAMGAAKPYAAAAPRLMTSVVSKVL